MTTSMRALWPWAVSATRNYARSPGLGGRFTASRGQHIFLSKWKLPVESLVDTEVVNGGRFSFRTLDPLLPSQSGSPG